MAIRSSALRRNNPKKSTTRPRRKSTAESKSGGRDAGATSVRRIRTPRGKSAVVYEPSIGNVRRAAGYFLQLAFEHEGLADDRPIGGGFVNKLRTRERLATLVNLLLEHRDRRQAYSRLVRVAMIRDALVQVGKEYAAQFRRPERHSMTSEHSAFLERRLRNVALMAQTWGVDLELPAGSVTTQGSSASGGARNSGMDLRVSAWARLIHAAYSQRLKEGGSSGDDKSAANRISSAVARAVGQVSRDTLEQVSKARSSFKGDAQKGAIRTQEEAILLQFDDEPDLHDILPFVLDLHGVPKRLRRPIMAALPTRLELTMAQRGRPPSARNP